MRRLTHPVFLSLACFLALVWTLAATLRPDAFYVGDQGVKLVATRNALLHPGRPLEIPLPFIGTSPAPHVDPFFTVHGTHAHAVTSDLFPIMSAPLLELFGLRGLYIWPALGFVATLAACGALAQALGNSTSPALVIVLAGLGTPFLFYGLEFWEHAPALAVGTSGAALLVRSSNDESDRAAALWSAVAGVLFGLSIALRAEAVCFVAAVVAATFIWNRQGWRAAVWCVVGLALALMPLEVYAVSHFGQYLPVHVDTNAAAMPATFSRARLTLAAQWLLPSGERFIGGNVWTVAPAALVSLGSLCVLRRSRRVAMLWFIALTTTALATVLAPNAGGGQWGVRYLLFSYVPLVILAADALARIPNGVMRKAAIAIVVLVSLLVQRTAYRELRGTKNTYGRLVDAVAANTTAGTPLVTDVWWLDQLAAATLAHDDVLFAGDAGVGRDIVRRLSELVVPSVTVVRSREVSADVGNWSENTCYFEEGRSEAPVRQVVLIRLRHRCGYTP